MKASINTTSVVAITGPTDVRAERSGLVRLPYRGDTALFRGWGVRI